MMDRLREMQFFKNEKAVSILVVVALLILFVSTIGAYYGLLMYASTLSAYFKVICEVSIATAVASSAFLVALYAIYC